MKNELNDVFDPWEAVIDDTVGGVRNFVKTINTYPFGKKSIISFSSCLLISIIVLVSCIVTNEIHGVIGSAISAFIFFVLILYSVRNHFWNSITLNELGIKYKSQYLSWNDVHLTIVESKLPILIRGTVGTGVAYFLYFDTHFLSQSQIQERERQGNGFFILAKPNRFKSILPFYKRRIKVLNASPFFDDYLGIINSHNLNSPSSEPIND